MKDFYQGAAPHQPQKKCYFHLFTPEDHPVVFSCRREFKVGMSLIAICAAMFPGISILTFELMSNHIHVVLYATEDDAYAFFLQFRTFLQRWFQRNGHPVDLSRFICKLKAKEDTESIRNTVSYTNRNGFLVYPDYTPFSYPWGANSYMFNPDARKKFEKESTPMTMTYRRKVTRSRKADEIRSLKMVDGYASPLSFCNITAAEELYNNAAGYFYEISRNIEAHKSVAADIGEREFYTDQDLIAAVRKKSRENYDENNPTLLPVNSKLALARFMHYDYNADCKQIARILKLNLETVKQMFPAPKE